MAHQVIWTEQVLNDFIKMGNLNEMQTQIMRTRCKNMTVIQQSQLLNCSESSVHREIAKIKKIYREFCCKESIITAVLSGVDATVNVASIVVEKI